MQRKRLLEPFYEQTLQRQMMHPFHHLFRRQTSMVELVNWTSANPGVPLRGLIFHISRCGSTLLSQMLAAIERTVVASEPAPFDGVLRAHLRAPALAREMQVKWLRGMASAIGRPTAGSEQALYIKLDCWHIHAMELIQEAFPSVPWIFSIAIHWKRWSRISACLRLGPFLACFIRSLYAWRCRTGTRAGPISIALVPLPASAELD
jgi:hypothetical protein